MILRTAMLALATTAMIGTQTLAAGVGPLAPGKPAGVQEAQGSTRLWVVLGVSAVIVGAVAVAMASNDYTPCGDACADTITPPSSSTGTR
jgi:hypothetical protein